MILDDQTIEKLADAIAARLRGTPGLDVYTSVRLPADIGTRAAFNQIARTIPGAVKRGKSWVVRCDAWHDHRERQNGVAATGAVDQTCEPSVAEIARRVLAGEFK